MPFNYRKSNSVQLCGKEVK